MGGFLEKLCFLMFLEKPATKAPELGRAGVGSHARFPGRELCFLMFLEKPDTKAPDLGHAGVRSHAHLPGKVVFFSCSSKSQMLRRPS